MPDIKKSRRRMFIQNGSQMEIVINGETREVPSPTSIDGLLRLLDLKEDRVAIELNRVIVRRDRWTSTELQPNDRLEIVQFVGGG